VSLDYSLAGHLAEVSDGEHLDLATIKLDYALTAIDGEQRARRLPLLTHDHLRL